MSEGKQKARKALLLRRCSKGYRVIGRPSHPNVPPLRKLINSLQPTGGFWKCSAERTGCFMSLYLTLTKRDPPPPFKKNKRNGTRTLTPVDTIATEISGNYLST